MTSIRLSIFYPTWIKLVFKCLINENIQYSIYLYHSHNPSFLWLWPTIFSPPHHNPLHWPRIDKSQVQVKSRVPNPQKSMRTAVFCWGILGLGFDNKLTSMQADPFHISKFRQGFLNWHLPTRETESSSKMWSSGQGPRRLFTYLEKIRIMVLAAIFTVLLYL